MTMQAACSGFISRIVKDFKQKELLPLKLLFFVHASTLFVLYPYLTIHMRELGINVEETAIMSAVTPVVAIIMPPVAGMVADKIGNFKLLLCLFSSLGGGAALLLLVVPVGRITVSFPEESVLALRCASGLPSVGENARLELEMARDFPCNRSDLLSNESFSLTAQMRGCGFVCERDQFTKEVHLAYSVNSGEEVEDELSVDAVLKARSYEIEMLDTETKERTFLRYNITKLHVPHSHTKEQALSDRFMDNNENWQTSIRRVSESLYYLPTASLGGLACTATEEDSLGSSEVPMPSVGRFSRFRRGAARAHSCEFLDADNSSEVIIPNDVPVTYALEKSPEGAFVTDSMEWGTNAVAPYCHKQKYNATAKVFLHNPEDNSEVLHEINLHKCQPRCLVTAKRSETCRNLEKQIIYNPSLTFWVYMVIRVFIGIIGGTSFAMFEGAVIAILRDQKADYGLQRIYASIGGMISSPLSGALIDWASQGKGYTDFRPAFYLYAALKLFGGLLMLTINLEFKTGAKNVVSDVMTVLKKVEVIALLVASFILGTSWGYIESFLFWLLQDLGGSRSLMGITITVGGVAGIPLLAMSGPLIEKIGHANVIFIGFVFYAVRLLGYSLIYNPWHCLFFEAMESITTSLAFTAAVTYAARLSTSTTDSSIQGLLGGLYFGVGKGAGSLVGGFLMNEFGTRTTFQMFAVFTLFMGCIYFFFNRFYISKLPQTETNDICKSETKAGKEEKWAVANGLKKRNSLDKITEFKTSQAHENAAYISDLADEGCEKTNNERDAKVNREDCQKNSSDK